MCLLVCLGGGGGRNLWSNVFFEMFGTGTTEENLYKLIQHVKIEDDKEFIVNWKELGVPIISSVSEKLKAAIVY